MIEIIQILITPNSRELKIIKPLDNLYLFKGQVLEFVDELVYFFPIMAVSVVDKMSITQHDLTHVQSQKLKKKKNLS